MLKNGWGGKNAQTYNLLNFFQATNSLLELIAKNKGLLNAEIGDDGSVLQDIVDNNKALIDDFRETLKINDFAKFSERKIILEISLVKELLEESFKYHVKCQDQIDNASVTCNTSAFLESIDSFVKHPDMMTYIYLIKCANRLLGSLEGAGVPSRVVPMGVGHLYGDNDKELMALAKSLNIELMKNKNLFCFEEFLEMSKKQN